MQNNSLSQPINEAVPILRDDIPEQCRAYWLFNDTGGKIIDLSGYGNHLTSYGATSAVSKYGNYCRSCDGVDDYLIVEGSNAATHPLYIRDMITIELVMLLKAYNVNNDVFTCGGNAYSSVPWTLGYTGKFMVNHATAGTKMASLYGSGDVGKVIHLVGIYDGQTVKAYKNGVLTGSDSFAVPGNLIPAAFPVTIGAGANASNSARAWFSNITLYQGAIYRMAWNDRFVKNRFAEIGSRYGLRS